MITATGTKFIKWTVIGNPVLIGKNKVVLCRCDCGTEKQVRIICLTKGLSTNCGCSKRTHQGESKSNIHILWSAIIRRCYKNHDNALYYQNRGISVCKEWKDNYFAFKKWALENGYKKGLQIDRKDNNGNYDPYNCRFVTISENGRNKRNNVIVEYKGEKILLIELVERLNLTKRLSTIRARIRIGWDIESALFRVPVNELKESIVDGYEYLLP